jgi:hypothetical protein
MLPNLRDEIGDDDARVSHDGYSYTVLTTVKIINLSTQRGVCHKDPSGHRAFQLGVEGGEERSGGRKRRVVLTWSWGAVIPVWWLTAVGNICI